jgi:hypothetical protein
MEGATEAWEQALDLLEADLLCAERLAETGAGGLPDWAPPSLDGPLPEGLRARAADLQDRQQRLQERLHGLLARTGHQLDVARKVSARARPSGRSAARAALYIDTTA